MNFFCTAITRRLLYVCLLFSCIGSAQTFFSTDPNYIREKKEGNNPITRYHPVYPDTSIDFISEFLPRNFLGNYGLASPEYTLRFGADEPGFRIHPMPLRNDRFDSRQATYYRTEGPFASLTGVAGSRELQVFKLLFTHTFRRKLNVALHFNRYTSMGYYNRQQTYANNLLFTMNYTGSSRRAGYYFYVLNNGNRNFENGGILGDTLNDSLALLRTDLRKVRISSASRDNRETAVMFNPWLRVNAVRDTAPVHVLQLKSRFSMSSLRYSDSRMRDDKFYLYVFLDTVQTRDSIRLQQFRNDALYAFQSANKQFSFSGGFRNEINTLWQHGDSVMMNNFIVAGTSFNRPGARNDSVFRRPYGIDVQAQYAVNGPLQGNYQLISRAFFAFDEKGRKRIFGNFLVEERVPDYIYNRWISNHFYWTNNGYKPVTKSQLQAGLAVPHFTISAIQEVYNRYLYFDETATPVQFNGQVTNTALNVTAGGIFFRNLGIYGNYIFQQTSNKSILRIPPQVITARLFYNAFMFRNALQLQIGGQLQVYDAFYPYAFMPATQVFYLQNTYRSEQYPYLDLFLQARIRPVNFFFKLENVLGGTGNGYSLVRGYYQPAMAFRFGLNWMFFD